MNINRFGVNPSKKIPRDLPVMHNDEVKYRIHKLNQRWYLCDTVALPHAVTSAEQERRNGWGRLHTLDGRVCRDLHLPQYAYSDFHNVHAAYLSQIS